MVRKLHYRQVQMLLDLNWFLMLHTFDMLENYNLHGFDDFYFIFSRPVIWKISVRVK